MAKTSKKIAQDLLREANYYWYDDNVDNVNPLNPDTFDPVVDKIFKANAMELEKLYAEIEESQNEIILNLSKALVPDLSLLPEPGYTVVHLRPKAARVYTSPEDHFQITGQSDTGERYDYYFTPLFEHNYPKCEVAAILTDHSAIRVENNQAHLVQKSNNGKAIASIWLGLNLAKVKEKDVISFFLGNSIVDEFDKNHHLFRTARWLLNGSEDQVLKVEKGIAAFGPTRNKKNLLDTLDIPHTHEKQIFNRLGNSFIHVSLPTNINDYQCVLPPALEKEELALALENQEELCWIKVEFPLALPQDFFLHHTLYPNAVPLVNRRLNDKFVIKSNYDRILLPMPTTDLFLAVHQVQDVQNKEDNSQYQKVDCLHPDSQPGTFTLRSGSRVRRLNREDASHWIYRLLEVIGDEYNTFKEEGVNRLREDFDIIEQAMMRIKSQLPAYFRGQGKRSSYFCIANFRPQAERLHYSYWETQGDLIRHLGDKIGLALSSSDVKITDSHSIIPIQYGKGELSSDDYINQLKTSLLSRGRIMTKGDIELFCNSRYGHLLKVADISHQLMVLNEGQRGRGILVQIVLTQALPQKETELIRVELQNDLNAKSAFFTFIKVELSYD